MNVSQTSMARAMVTAQATAAFVKLPGTPEQKRHAFVGVGWACIDAAKLHFSPLMCRISNFYDNGKVLVSAKSAFTLDYKIYNSLASFAWTEVGAEVYAGEVATLTRRLRN